MATDNPRRQHDGPHTQNVADNVTDNVANRPDPAPTAHIGTVVYFSSASENTARFVEHCHLDELGIDAYRIPLRQSDQPLQIREPFVLIAPTYGGGVASKAVPPQVKRFLNNPDNRPWIRGVIASGNTNFGEAYGMGGRIIAAKCRVPLLFVFELMGTPADVCKTREGLVRFFAGIRTHANADAKPTDT